VFPFKGLSICYKVYSDSLNAIYTKIKVSAKERTDRTVDILTSNFKNGATRAIRGYSRYKLICERVHLVFLINVDRR
jgi:hypothetical protein